MSRKGAFARGSAVVSLISFIGQILATLLKLIISRSYGLIGFGQYALIMAFTRFFSTVLQMGYHQSIVYFIARYRTLNDWVTARMFFVAGLKHILFGSAVLSGLLLVFKGPLVSAFEAGLDEGYLLIAIAFISILIGVSNYFSSVLRSLKKNKEQALLFNVSFPAIMIIALILAKWIIRDSSDLISFLFLGILLNLILLVVVYVRTQSRFGPKAESQEPETTSKELLGYSRPVWISSVLQSAGRSSDRIMLGFLSTIAEVGIYGAGYTVSILFAFPLRAMGPVFQPYIVEFYEQRNFEEIGNMYNTMVRWSALFVIPSFIGLICFGEVFTGIFGAGFERAYLVMIVLSFAQMISTISGLAGTLLNMTEKQGVHARINAWGFVIAIVLNFLLIPGFGALGAAVATSLTILFSNVSRVRRLLEYFSIRTDYAGILWLTAKFLPLALLTYWFNTLALVHWSALIAVYSLVSAGIIYSSLEDDEKGYIRKRLGRMRP